MSKKLILKFEAATKEYPPIVLEIAIPDDLATTLQATTIVKTTLAITDSLWITPEAQKEEVKTGDINRFKIL